MKRIVSLLLAALTLSAAGCSKAPEALDMPSKTQSQVEQALPESGKRLDEIALPEAQTRQDQPVVTDQAVDRSFLHLHMNVFYYFFLVGITFI